MKSKIQQRADKKAKRGHGVKKALIIVGSIVGALVVGVASYNGLKYLIFHDFFSVAKQIRVNPGLNDGFVPQGIQLLAEDDSFLTSGYMNDKSASRVYLVDKDNKISHSKIYKQDGKPATYHFGGMSRIGDAIALASGDSLHIVGLDDLRDGDEKATIQAVVSVENAASYVYSDAENTYVGEFNDWGNGYECHHDYTDSEGKTTHAILTKYSNLDIVSSATTGTKPTPLARYSIVDRVQGAAFTGSQFVLATSWALNPSHYYFYDAPSIPDLVEDGVPVYHLDARYLKKDLVGPSMAEDLDYRDGHLYNMGESASNKYIFGKLFFYNYIYDIKVA